MPAFLASYDYHWNRDYTRVYDLMDYLGAVRILESAWLVNVNVRAPVLRDTLVACGDGDESFIALELVPGADWATRLAPKTASEWLSAFVAPGGD